MPVDNELYRVDGDIWWDEKRPLSSLRTGVNPARMGYLVQVLERTELAASGSSALDIGCGGGLMAEEVARMGFRVTGVDPAAPAVRVARSHAAESGLDITYRESAGEALPFADASFDLVYCCDVLEHVADLDQVIAESVRVLKPGGLYFYDTINRTAASRFLMIKLFQEWRATAWLPANLHAWEQFIKPGELRDVLLGHGLDVAEPVGLAPGAPPPRLLLDLLRLRRGAITYGEFGRRSAFRITNDTSILYAGYGIKRAA